MSARPVLVTGAAGFIGSTLVDRLLAEGRGVAGLDCFEPFYSRAVKERNLEHALKSDRFALYEADTRDRALILELFERLRPSAVIDLAARPGVRDSLADPWLYIDINVRGLQNVLTAASRVGATYVFASSSSVYGSQTPRPFHEDDMRARPESPYGATKIAGEALVRAHHAATALPVRIARLFTVYGPRQRPDLAIHKFAARIVSGSPIPLYAHGMGSRDYTYVDDIVDGFVRLLDSEADELVVNLGSHRPYTTLEVVRRLEAVLGRAATIDLQPAQPGDLPATYADVTRASETLCWAPKTTLDAGLEAFCAWFTGPQGPGGRPG